MKQLILLGLLFLATVAGAQDQMRIQNGKTFNCRITDVQGANLNYIDLRDSSQVKQVSLNLVEFLFIQDSTQANTWAKNNRMFQIVYQSKVEQRIAGRELTGYQLMKSSGDKQSRAYKRLIGSVLVSNIGAIAGVVVSQTSLLAAGIITGGFGVVAVLLAVNGYYLLIEGADDLRKAGEELEFERTLQK
ncbi:MAG: hypothetical protein Q8J69_08600 [Sphingobacteriaceae bacterium]|nr:hypothetical protein [Sphingobacteriaceae bacterium]